jgi:endonuclease YncB( thermonuclease family)
MLSPALTLLATLALGAPPADVAGRVTKVVDGDTLHVRPEGDAGFPGRKARELKVRLYGADAPEKDQPHGREARRALEALTEGREVLLHPLSTDRFGRTVARVEVDGRDVSEALVEAGHAWAFRRYLGKRAGDERLCALEYQARAGGAGLWALPPAQRAPPWAVRHGERPPYQVDRERGPADCVRAFERQGRRGRPAR